MRKVLVFGTFDGLHDGHRFLFRHARAHGEQLIVVVAHDETVKTLKHHPPGKDLEQRMEALGKEDLIDIVAAGDIELGTYAVIKRYRPDVIALGYDQTALRDDLEATLREFDWEIELITIPPHEPEKYHSSLLDRDKK